MKYFILLFTLLFHTLVYSQLNTSNRTVNQKLYFKAGANFDSLTADRPAYIDSSGDIVSQLLDLTTDVTGVLPLANGGTGSATQNFVDLTTNQSISGEKTFTDDTTIDASGSGDALTIDHSGSGNALNITQSGSGFAIDADGSVNIAGNVTSTGDILMSGTGQIDLPVGTTAQRSGSPNSGMLRFNSETSSFEGYNGSAWGSIGGGGGGLDIFYNEDHESATNSSDYTTGLNATFDNGGTLGGTLANETTNPIAGATSIKYTTSATATNSTNDWIASASITLDDKQKGNFVGFNFFYTWDGSDDLLCVIVWDDTNDEVLNDSTDCLKTASNPTRYSLGVFIPTSANAIKLGFHHTGASESSKVLVFDDLELSSNPFVYKNITEFYTYQIRMPTVTDYNNEIRLTNPVTEANISGNTSLITPSDDSGGARTIWTANEPVHVSVAGTGTAGGGNRRFDIFKNGVAIITGNYSDAARPVNVAGHVFLEAGDYLSFQFPSTDGTGIQNITIQAYRDSEHVITPAKATLTDWESYTPTTQGFGTVTNMDARWRRIGDTIEVKATWNNGTVAASEAQFGLPNSYTVGDGSTEIVGTWGRAGGGSAQEHGGVALATDGDAFVNISDRAIWSGTGKDTLTPANGNRTGLNSEKMSIEFSVQVSELTSDATFLAAIPVQQTCYLKDVKSSGTNGGSTSASTTADRDLNTTSGSCSFLSLSSNQITLPAGFYEVSCQSSCLFTQRTRSIISDSSNTPLLLGNSNYTGSPEDIGITTSVSGILNFSNTTVIKLRQYTQRGQSITGQGLAMSDGNDEVYSTCKITKIK